MTNMQKYAPRFADEALPLQVGVRSDSDGCYSSPAEAFLQWHPLCQGRGFGGWFYPSTGQRSGLNVYPVGVLSRDILGYPILFGNILG